MREPAAIIFEPAGMKRVCVFYFSGTGMTKYVVDKFAGELVKRHISVDCFSIENAAVQSAALSEYDAFGIAYPIHSFNAPKIVIDYAKQLPKTNGAKTFIIHTAGEDAKVNYASSDLLIKILKSKGYHVFYNKLIEMPSNFIVKYDDERVGRILAKANDDIPLVAEEIIGGRPGFLRKSFSSMIITFFGRAEWSGARLIGKHYHVRNNCTRCGLCAANCPNGNIAMNNKSVGFGWRCGICMRCVYLCPQNAIGVRQPFKFIRFDKWYDSGALKLSSAIAKRIGTGYPRDPEDPRDSGGSGD